MNDCVHYWVLEPPDGSTSLGTCRNCQEVREFVNTYEEGGKNIRLISLGKEYLEIERVLLRSLGVPMRSS